MATPFSLFPSSKGMRTHNFYFSSTPSRHRLRQHSSNMDIHKIIFHIFTPPHGPFCVISHIIKQKFDESWPSWKKVQFTLFVQFQLNIIAGTYHRSKV
ncbi:hypothetical protein CR513_29561, partial [Mucuna pruriens]